MEEFMTFDDNEQIRERLTQVKKEMDERAKRISEARLFKAKRSEKERVVRKEKEHRLKYAEVIAYEFAMFDVSKVLEEAVEKKLITKKALNWAVKEFIRIEGNSLQRLRKCLEYGKW